MGKNDYSQREGKRNKRNSHKTGGILPAMLNFDIKKEYP